MSWPTKVPILDARDICRGRAFQGEKRCLLGWTAESFGGVEVSRVRRLLQEECGYEPTFNDNQENSLRKIANVWNRVMRKLGYTEDCER